MNEQDEELYKGYRIIPYPTSLTRDTGPSEKFNISVEIGRNGPDKPTKTFTADGQYAATKQEAARQALEFGRLVIDGRVPGKSVTDL